MDARLDDRTYSARPLDDAERALEEQLAPPTLDDYVGQRAVRGKLRVALAAARTRGTRLEHVLISGPAGVGKSALARLVPVELGVGTRTTEATALERLEDLAALFGSLAAGDTLVVEDVHRLDAAVESALAAAAARAPFTLVATTTHVHLLTPAFRDVFDVVHRLDPCPPADLERVLARAAERLDIAGDAEAFGVLARASQGLPRIALRILRRVGEHARGSNGPLTSALVRETLPAPPPDLPTGAVADRRQLVALVELVLELKDRIPALTLAVDTTPAAQADTREQLLSILESLSARQTR